MKMCLKIAWISGLLLLTGCRELTFKGSLQVEQVLTIKNSNNKVVSISPGAYAVDFVVGSKKVEVTIPTAQKQKQVLVLRIPKGLEVPVNGNFRLTSAQSGQPFDLNAEIQTQITESAPQRDLETCTAERYEQVCFPSGPQGQISCQVRPVTYWGRRSVTYINRQYVRNLKASWNQKDSEISLAQSTSRNQQLERVYLQQGACY